MPRIRDVCMALVFSFSITPLQALRISASQACKSVACDMHHGHVRVRQSCVNHRVKHIATGFDKFHDFDLQGLIAFPEQSFAFCTIPKNACSEWLQVLWNIYRKDKDFSWSGDVQDYKLIKKYQKCISKSSCLQQSSGYQSCVRKRPHRTFGIGLFEQVRFQKGALPHICSYVHHSQASVVGVECDLRP